MYTKYSISYSITEYEISLTVHKLFLESLRCKASCVFVITWIQQTQTVFECVLP